MAIRRKTKIQIFKYYLRRLSFLSLLIALPLCLFTLAYYFSHQPSSNSKENNITTTDNFDTLKPIPAPKEDPKSQTPPDSKEPQIPQKPDYQSDNQAPNQLDHLTGVINYYGILNQKFQIYTLINQNLTEGQCILKLVSSQKTITRSSKIISNPSSSSCQTFNIELSEIGKIEKWTAIIEISSQNRQGIIKKEIKL